MKRAWIAALLWLMGGIASAHPLAPAMLELRETADADYEVLWRTSATRAGRQDISPQLPAVCRPLSVTRAALEGDAWVARWSVRCEGGLTGQRIAVIGLDASRIAVILRLQSRAGPAQQTVLDARMPAYEVPALSAAPAVLPAYFALGVEHLLFGFDHVLFICGLLLLVSGWRALLLTVTEFTLGHSVTLSLASLGIVRVSAGWMELGIALSILWLACEIARPARAQATGLVRWPWVMAAGFGLLHGLGFAGALAQIGLPESDIPLALLAFNLGIEAGQLLLVAVVLGVQALWRRGPVQPVLRRLPPYVIGSLAAFWCFERATALWMG